MTPTTLNHLSNVKRSIKYLHRVTSLTEQNKRVLDCILHLETNFILLEKELKDEHSS